MHSSEKIFIIGLPRTGTTSVCSTMLKLGFSVAHTAYTDRTFEQAQVIADTPIFTDYQLLDKAYPKAKFIYLARDLDNWLPSISQLLQRMQHNLLRQDGGFNPIIKRCYLEVFSPFTSETIIDHAFLQQCYQQHQQQVQAYFSQRENDLLCIDVSDNNSLRQLCEFIGIDYNLQKQATFEHLNIGGKVTAWKDIKHSLKIESTNKGRATKLPYYESSIHAC